MPNQLSQLYIVVLSTLLKLCFAILYRLILFIVEVKYLGDIIRNNLLVSGLVFYLLKGLHCRRVILLVKRNETIIIVRVHVIRVRRYLPDGIKQRLGFLKLV